MAETYQLPDPSRPAGRTPVRPAGSRAVIAGSLLALVAVVAGSVLLGLGGGLVWEQVAPRAVFVVVGRGAANAVHPETTAFIAADGWFCVLGVAGGIVIGLLGYLLAVRRYGPLPMAGVLGGGLAAAYAARWIGQSGPAAFNAQLATARAGALLRAPLALGAHSALAFWPLAAGLVAGGLHALVLMRERQQTSAQSSAQSTIPLTAQFDAPYGAGADAGPSE